jgi:hypothetical protein
MKMRYMLNVYGFKFFANDVAGIQAQYDAKRSEIPAGETAVVYKLQAAGDMKRVADYITTGA